MKIFVRLQEVPVLHLEVQVLKQPIQHLSQKCEPKATVQIIPAAVIHVIPEAEIPETGGNKR